MILSKRIPHPASRSYVMKVDRDADPAGGRLCGRIENLATGRHLEFGSVDELLAALASDLADIGEPGDEP
jgi:hypothetical protein